MIRGFNNAVANNIIIGFKERRTGAGENFESKKRRRRFFDEFRCRNALEICVS